MQRENGPYVYEDKVSSGYYRNHNFDQPHIKRKIRQFKDVTGENRPFRGGCSVCLKWFKVDEEYIPAQNR